LPQNEKNLAHLLPQKRKKVKMRTRILLAVFLYTSLSASGQVFTDITPNAPVLSLGGATISLPDPVAGISNDALLGGKQRMGIWASAALPYAISGWQVAQVQGFVKVDKSNGLGLELSSGGTEALRETKILALYGRRLGERLRVGAGIGAVGVSAAEYGSAWGVDYRLSVMAQALPQLSIGASVQNPLASELSGAALPVRLRVGACWAPSRVLMISSEWDKLVDRAAAIKCGVRYQPVSRVVVQTGVRAGETARVALGLGVQISSSLWLHMAAEWNPYLNITPAGTVGWLKL
jgi:hypothetical protein